MRGVSKRVAVLSLLAVLAAQGAFAGPRDDDDRGWGGGTWGGRIKHLIVKILDQLGVPKP
jgi:hypothetical protein